MFIFAGDSGGGTVGSNGSIYSTLLAFDVSGNLIFNSKVQGGSSIININASNGIYFVRVNYLVYKLNL